ncbi:MAG TPA: hypothetical protein VIP46_14125 [Pyrinomonadaceae bacterium]
MSTGNNIEKPFTVQFIDGGAGVRLELTNTADTALKGVEILSVFLKDEETPGGGPSRAHIRFEALKCIRPGEKAVVSHRTWIDGKPSAPEADLLARLEVRAGQVKPYVLDISWEDEAGNTRYQRVPIGH